MAKSPNGVPTAAEFGLIRAYLARAGVSQAQVEAVIGKTVNKRTRAQLADLLKLWLRELPKA